MWIVLLWRWKQLDHRSLALVSATEPSVVVACLAKHIDRQSYQDFSYGMSRVCIPHTNHCLLSDKRPLVFIVFMTLNVSSLVAWFHWCTINKEKWWFCWTIVDPNLYLQKLNRLIEFGTEHYRKSALVLMLIVFQQQQWS